MSVDQAASVIHDIGYQRYAGPRLGRGYAVGSLYTHGLRTAYGLGRPGKSKIFPWSVAGIVGLVAAVATAVRAQTGQPVIGYAEFSQQMLVLVILFVAVVGPELVSRDIRSGVLPLYFSRALRTGDYALAKLAALTSAVWLLLGAPQLLMFLGGAFGTDDGLRGVWDEFTDLAAGLGYAAVPALVFSGIALLVASLTGKRAFAAGGIVAVFLATAPVTGVLTVLPSSHAGELANLANPTGLVAGVGVWAFGIDGPPIGDFGPLYALVCVLLFAGCAALLLARYRKAATK